MIDFDRCVTSCKETPCIVELSDSSGDGELTTTELFKINGEVK